MGLISSVSYSQSLLVSRDSSDYLEPDTATLFLDEDIQVIETQDTPPDSIIALKDTEEDSLSTVIKKDSNTSNLDTDSIIVVERDTVSSLDSTVNAIDNDSTLYAADSTYSLLTDSTYWVTVDSLFVKTSSFTVDPYGFDGAKFKDTVNVHLCTHGIDSLSNDSASCWSMPMDIDHHITSDFGSRKYRWHYGIDFRLSIGDTIRSVFDGVVRISKYNAGGYGYYVLVRHHNGLETIYGHLSKRIAQVGDVVKAGEVIGLGGNTGRSSGPHLHFEVRWKGDAVDPKYVYDFETNTIKNDLFVMEPSKFEYIRVMRRKVYHRIRSGDTLSGLAGKYRTSIRQLCRLNGISTRTTLRIGRTLRVR